jgi:hypothetical protein
VIDRPSVTLMAAAPFFNRPACFKSSSFGARQLMPPGGQCLLTAAHPQDLAAFQLLRRTSVLSTPRRRVTAITGLVLSLAAVLALAVASTGAYFTDSHPGQVDGTFGSVAVTLNGSGTGPENMQFNFTGMLPGQWKTATMTTTNTGSDTEDIYMVFTNANDVWSQVNTLGTYGEANVNGTDFNNLNNHYPQGTAGPYTNACGDTVSGISYLPHVNYLGTLNAGQSANYTFQFRYSACISNNAYQNQPAFSNPLEFDIAAFQSGVSPDDPHNGAGAVSPLTLDPGYYQ